MRRREFLAVTGTTATALPLWAAAAVDPAPDLKGFVEAYAREHRFSGSLKIGSKDTVRYAESFGLASIEYGVPHRPETRYWVASITKIMTAVLVLQLVEAGKVALDDTIGRHLPSYRGDARDRVTIHQLLNHTSGLANIDRIPNIEDAQMAISAALDDAREYGALPIYQTPYSSDALLDLFCSRPLAHPPGTVFDYNNADYIILGKVIEAAYGQSYADILGRRILKPLGMANSGMLRQQDVIPRLATNYSPGPEGAALLHDMIVYPENWYAAGALYSSIDDLFILAGALFGNRLLAPPTLQKMLTPGLDNYGCGLWSYTMKIGGQSHRVVKRPGQIMGARAQLFHMPDRDLTIVMAANTGTTDLDAFVAALARRIVGAP